jgi:hypothetical protein
MKAWEALPQESRDAFMVQEEDDRRRFMEEDEIANRHCATLTARGKSPRAAGDNKQRHHQQQQSKQQHQQQQDKVKSVALESKSKSQTQQQKGDESNVVVVKKEIDDDDEEKKTEEPIEIAQNRSSIPQAVVTNTKSDPSKRPVPNSTNNKIDDAANNNDTHESPTKRNKMGKDSK